MKRAVVIRGMLAWVAAIAARAEAPAPGPGPAHQKLEIFVGDWTFQGEIRVTPLGPAAN